MEKPWKWISDDYADWYYEKQKIGGFWTEFFKNEVSDEYLVEQSFDVKRNFPEILLYSITKEYYVELTSVSCTQFSLESLKNFYSNPIKYRGFWAKNAGKYLPLIRYSIK